MYTKILSTGSYVPRTVVTNADMEKLVETSDEWIRSRTGIEQRRIAIDENTSDLAYQASIKAIEKAAIDKHSIDLIIVATVSPDDVFPGVAQILQARLGLAPITAFDVNAACTGFVYALNIADKMIRSGAYHTALVVGAETLSKLTDFTDRNTCVLFADAAGAMIVTESETPGVQIVKTFAQGDTDMLLKMPHYPLKSDFKTPADSLKFISMQGREVFKFAVGVIPKVIHDLLDSTGQTLDDLTMIVAHQANQRILDKAAKDLEYPLEKMFQNIQLYGNTSAASVPLAIDEAIEQGHLKAGDLFATVAFGAGLTWGGALIRL